MSESSFPFEGDTALATAPAPVPALDEPSDNRSKLLLVGGLAVVVVLAVVGYFLFFAGSPAEEPVGPSKPRTIAPAAPVADPPAAESANRKLNAKSFGRDPFKALIVEAESAPADAVAPSGVTAPTGTTEQPATTGSTTTTPTATAAHSFRVVEVAPDNSTISVKVDGERYNNLRAGEVFAQYFKVVLISGTTNAFQYGEEKFNVLGTKRLTIA